MAELNAGLVIDRMQQVIGVQTDIALGAYFSRGSSAVSNWRSRGTVPFEECVILAKRKGVSLDWLLLGLGTMDSAIADFRVLDGDAVAPRLRRLSGFLAHWTATRSDDEQVWLEMQLARAIPDYAEWVSARSKSG